MSRVKRAKGRRRIAWSHLSTMKRLVAIPLVLALMTGVAWAYWTASSVPGGNGASAASTVSQGATPTANAAGTTVTVSWAATTLTSGQAVSGYVVKRYDSITPFAVQTIMSACTGTITALSCVESSVPSGSWRYSVTPKFATNWQGVESLRSNTVVVDTNPPTNGLTLSNVSGGAYKNANNIFYRGSAAGSFTLTNAVADAQSGPASSATATLTGTSTGWTHTPTTISTPAGGPYLSNTFSWAAATTTTPGEVVTGRDVAGNTAATTLTTTLDNTNPTGGSVTYADGVTAGRSVSVSFGAGTDAGSGINTPLGRLKRSVAPLVNGICGSYVTDNDFALSPTSPYVDSTVSNGSCYTYQYAVSDNVGNIVFNSSASVAKVHYGSAINADASLLSYWRFGESDTSPFSVDSYTGISGTALTSHVGEVGSTWAHNATNSNTTMQLSDANRGRRIAAGGSIDYVTTTPPSADYAVEADIHVKSTIADDHIGVIGRLNTGNTTFYMARWEGDNTWNIVKWSGGPSWIGTTAAPALTVSATYRVRLEVSGSTTTNLKLYVNDVLTVSGTDTTSPYTAAGKVGTMDGEAGSTVTKTDSTGKHLDNFEAGPITTSTNAVDSKGTNNGTYTNGPVLGVPGAIYSDTDTATTFDGTNDYMKTATTTGFPVGAATRSVETWFKTSGVAAGSSRQALFSYGTNTDTQEFGVWLEQNGTQIKSDGGGASDRVLTWGTSFNDSKWHHFVSTYDGTSTKMYVDGVLGSGNTTATRNTVINAAYSFAVGAILDTARGSLFGTSDFNGSLDEMAFYNTALSPATITNHYELGVAPPAPVVTTNASTLAYTENGTTTLDAGLTVTDASSANLTSATVTMTTAYVNGQDTLGFTNQNGITGTWTAATGVLALTGTATVANYQSALRSITYTNDSNAPTTTTRTVTIVANDATYNSNTASRTITLTAVNDGPVNSVPGAQTTSGQAAKVFSTGNGNLISISDADVASATVQVQLVATNGTTTLSASTGLTFSVGDGTADGTMTFTGATTSVNEALSGLSFTPTGSGATSLQIVTSDQGNTGTGGTLTDSDTISFAYGLFTTAADIGAATPSGSSTYSGSTYTEVGNGADVWGSSDQFHYLYKSWTGDGTIIARVTALGNTDVNAKAGVMFRETSGVGSAHALMDVKPVGGNGFEYSYRSSTGGSTNALGTGGPAPTYWVKLVRSGNTFAGHTAPDTSGTPGAWTQRGNQSITMASTILVGLATNSHNAGASTTATYDNVSLSGPPALSATGSTLAYTENATPLLDSAITATDADSSTLTSATVSMTTAYVNGQDTLAFTNQNGITGTWTAATGVLALTGTASVANYQTALRSITYSNNSNAPDTSTRTVTFVASDGTATSNTASRTITLTAVNDGPVNSVPGAQTTSANTPLVFSTGNGNLISISDADAAAGLVQVQLVSTNGTTTLSGTTGLTFSAGDGTADATMTFTGSVTNVNLRLSGLTFTPTAGGATSLQIVTSDQGNTGTGGPLTDNDTISFGYGLFTTIADIGAGAAGPTSSAYSGSTYTEVGNGTDIWGTSDQFRYLYKPWTGDGTIITRVTALGNTSVNAKAGIMFRESTAPDSAHVTMHVKPVGGNGLEWLYRGSSGATTIGAQTAGLAPVYWVKLVRSGNTFTGSSAPDASGSPGAWTQRGTQTVAMASTILVGLTTCSFSATATTTATYDNVSLAAPAAPVLTASGSTLAYTENATPALDSAITVADADSANLSSATVTMTTAYVNGQDTLAFTNQNGITGTWTAATGVLALTGSATVAQYQTALRSITYNNNSNAPTTTTRTVTFVAGDGAMNSDTASRTITLTAVNDAPLNSVPSSQTMTMNTPLVFSSGNGNLISISDSDAASSPVQVQLTATNATLTLSGTTGLTFTAGDGTADATMTFTGTIANVNLRLAGMSATATSAGPITVQIITSDQGSSGTGGTLSDNDNVTATFQTYPFEVNGDSPWAFLRGEEAPSSAVTSTATDASANARPGTYAGQTNGPSTHWELAEGTGTVAADGSGAANAGTIGAGNTWLTDRTDKVLNFNGTSATTGYVQGAGPGVRTDSSFTVSAWVNTTTGTGFKTAVSQPGANTSGFYLQLDNTGKWAFNLPQSDSSGSTGDIVQSSAAATTNTWTHLVGVYDDAANTGRLYVNGVSQGTVAHTDANEWNASGLMQAGRAWWNGSFTDAWAGKLDDVRSYRRALSAADVTAVYGDAPSLAYDFEENTGTTTADRSGAANAGTLGAGAAWTTAGHTGNALAFDNTATDYVTSAAAPIDTTASFTVSTWVNMNAAGAATKGILSQQGVNESTLILKREGTGKWGYSLATTSLGAADQILSSSAAATGSWVHLVAVYDSAAGAGQQMKLYVNNALAASGGHTTTYGTTNPLNLSRIRFGGAWVDPFDGKIDDVRTYRRALTTTEISNLYTPVVEAGMTAGVPGALQGAQQGQQSTTAVAFGGTNNAYNNTSVASPGPTAFTIEGWFKASGTTGGQLIGFANDQTGIASASRDRLIYLDSGGRLTFGTWPSGAPLTVRSPAAYNDGAWHHVAGSLGAAGLKLYVDGALVASDATTTTAGSYAGYWRWGGGNLGLWPNTPTNHRFTGTLDEVAIYSSQLSDTQIAQHFYANH